MPITKVQGNSGHGEGYKYSHDYAESYVPQAYLPEGRIYYEPTENGLEKRVKERLDHWRELFEEDQRKSAARNKSNKQDPPAPQSKC